jgi:hypothetical protein
MIGMKHEKRLFDSSNSVDSRISIFFARRIYCLAIRIFDSAFGGKLHIWKNIRMLDKIWRADARNAKEISEEVHRMW